MPTDVDFRYLSRDLTTCPNKQSLVPGEVGAEDVIHGKIKIPIRQTHLRKWELPIPIFAIDTCAIVGLPFMCFRGGIFNTLSRCIELVLIY